MRTLHEPFRSQSASDFSPVEVKPARLIRLPEVIRQTGLARSSIYDGIRAGTFPKPVPLCGRNVAWVESEIQQWIAERIAASRGAA
jgi:prophage regulatory protein